MPKLAMHSREKFDMVYYAHTQKKAAIQSGSHDTAWSSLNVLFEV